MAEEANPFLCSSRLAGSSMSRCSLNSFCLSPLCLLVKLVSICSRRWRLNFFWKIHGLAFSSNILSGIILLKEILKGKPGGNESNVSKHILRGSWIPFPKSRKKKKKTLNISILDPWLLTWALGAWTHHFMLVIDAFWLVFWWKESVFLPSVVTQRELFSFLSAKICY